MSTHLQHVRSQSEEHTIPRADEQYASYSAGRSPLADDQLANEIDLYSPWFIQGFIGASLVSPGIPPRDSRPRQPSTTTFLKPQALEADNLSWTTRNGPEFLNDLSTSDPPARNDGNTLNESSNKTLHNFEFASQQNQWISDEADPLMMFDEIGVLSELGTYDETSNPNVSRDQFGPAQDKYGLSQGQGIQPPGQSKHVSLPKPPIEAARFGHQANSMTQQDSDSIHAARVLQCISPGCPLGPGGAKEKIFKRKFELDRHMLKHSAPNRYRCPAINCKKQFSRADKLKDHVRKGHDEDTLFTCPVQGCELLKWPFLRVELYNHVGTHDDHARQQYQGHFAALN